MVEQHGKTLVPQIRFFDFTDPWEQRKLGEFGSVAMCKRIYKEQTSEQGDVPFFKIGTFGANPDAFISNELFEDFKRIYPYPTPGTLLISAAGSIGRVVEYQGEKAYFQDSNIVWLEHDHRLNDAFLKPLYSRIEWGLEGSTIKRLYNKDLLSAEVTVPGGREQEEIGQFFAKLDNLITFHQRKYDKLCVLKKSMLDKMFPKGGSLYPEIRFAGFADPWEQRKLGELFEESDERASDREILSVSVANGIYPASESDRETNPGASLANYKIVHSGDVVYNSMRMWQGAVDASRYDGIVSPAYVVARPNYEVYARFFARLLRQPMLLKQYRQVSQGNSKDTQVLKFDDFASIGISMPVSENEQRRIGGFFDLLDSLITLHQRKLELLRNIKKSMLDKMFV